ncbi:MAG: DsbE family thiol:disulfide interchange protein [Mesorhizobium sp.]|uniref:DsbE family thiol:disulfide interchange protein n=1 Tax=Mesorhizobium sp. TaxID=1871066 RepID=UPI000FE7B73A|nr:DsbE family thiol:disulfide interchange protein [Mesorhizobium sp.]RWH81220.1 MAG: DsbE family thiol:disulfide interchange protein [Mesorhizobium sp.]RWH85807.1 MAG: DsbE family thiol:disulfide interchange protein [Mesorhizobium sp.]RWH91064.1 MAG: DsbE family thiol:disulfide interchange protein [Mesorhizobium sp.]RWH99746.1 MAG: DsbE family thiol:disulfide interchange protein [Mesorhizobium sp.]RWI04012.1 MAG: DsbE family thiol:disulfide interchange protein [Mesorhizobium sp.]
MTAGDDIRSDAVPTEVERRTVPRRLVVLLPVTLFAILAGLLAWGLTRNATDIPSALIGKAVPEFSLPPVQGRTLGLSSGDLLHEVSLVNVFASWCVACREEHPVFMRLAASKKVPLHGLNYKDRPDDAARWLDTMVDPYARTGADLNGRVAIDWGVYGVPETFVVSADGHIAYKHIGAVTEQALTDTILPLVERLRAEAKERQP